MSIKHEYGKRMVAFHSVLNEYVKFTRTTEIKKIVIENNEIIMTTDRGISFVCNPADPNVPYANLNFGAYEFNETNMILDIIGTDDIVFDIGANIGWYSLNIAKTYPRSIVYSFEPIAPTRQIMMRNIQLSDCHNIEVFANGFWNEPTVLEFHFNKDASGATSVVNLLDRSDVEKIPCKVTTLDSFVGENSIAKLDFIKCDVEGAEFMVMQGAKTTLNTFKPKLFLEMLRKWSRKFNYHPNDIIEFLTELGYGCFEIIDRKLKRFSVMTEDTISTNFVFLHNEKHRAVIDELSD
ncbi:hypothetical protein AGMMS49959_10730 [Planctomycetales bacterium]|nr:hypothetical protein AGMMS49959_10730 [Planctomycetales bacterium]